MPGDEVACAQPNASEPSASQLHVRCATRSDIDDSTFDRGRVSRFYDADLAFPVEPGRETAGEAGRHVLHHKHRGTICRKPGKQFKQCFYPARRRPNGNHRVAKTARWRAKRRSTGGGRLASAFPDPSRVVVPARYRFGQLTIVDAEVGDGLAVTAFLDSGAQSTVGNLALKEAAVLRDPDLALRTVRVQDGALRSGIFEVGNFYKRSEDAEWQHVTVPAPSTASR